MFRKTSLLAISLFVSLMLSAQKTLSVSGEDTYYAPTNITLDQAKAIALERAKNKAIADHFGTVVGVKNFSEVSNDNGISSQKFLSIGESEVKGEWIETIGKPTYEVTYAQNAQIIKVKVRGTIRELKAAKIDFDARLLRNGIEDKFESDTFRDGDDIFISFTTPEDGYLAIFLYDLDGVNRLLPMKNDKEGSIRVLAGERQVFFKQLLYQYDYESGRNVEKMKSIYNLVCNSDNEMNRIYIVYSPNRFSRPNDNIDVAEDMLASMTFESFQKWLAKCRKQDTDMVLQIKDIIINK